LFKRFPKKVRFTPRPELIFLIGRRAGRDSGITYEFPARGRQCRNTDEFPVPVTAALIGRLMAFLENA
jgi:hypothetical protein